MKIKKGDYIRTYDGFIGKVKSIEPIELGYNHYCFENTFIEKFDIDIKLVKRDPIDLIEPQDLMYIDIDNDYAGGIIVPRVAETMWELERYIDRLKNKEVTLVSIVTHEQLNNCMCKVVK